jgi:fatty-acyl-CoA synthase
MGPRALGKMLVGNMIVTAAARTPNHLAFYCSGTGRRFTFRETNERSNRLANALLERGFSKACVLAFLCSNRAEMAEIYFALAKSGIVGIPINYRLAPTEISELMRAMGAQGLIYESRFESCAAHVREHLPQLRCFIAIGGATQTIEFEYEALLATASALEPSVDIEEADSYYYNLTSGTTGLPKSYLLTQFNNSSIATFGTAFDMTRQDVVLTSLPMFGRIGVGWTLISVMYGIPNVIGNFDAEESLRLIQAEKVTITNLVPTMASMILADPSLKTTDLSSLRAIIFAGSVLPAAVRQQSAKLLCANIYEYYGMQETGVLAYSTPQDRELRPDSVGRASLFAEVKILRPDGEPAAIGEIGEIVGRSPNSATAYFDDPRRSAETFRDGWLHTGDLGCFDAEGFLFVRGRTKDMIISGGQNVYAAEVEEVMLRHDAVADCAVLGLPDTHWGERVIAVVLLKPGKAATEELLQDHCRGQIAGFKTPKQVFFESDALPRTATGKVQKFLLLEKCLHPTETQSTPDGTPPIQPAA